MYRLYLPRLILARIRRVLDNRVIGRSMPIYLSCNEARTIWPRNTPDTPRSYSVEIGILNNLGAKFRPRRLGFLVSKDAIFYHMYVLYGLRAPFHPNHFRVTRPSAGQILHY